MGERGRRRNEGMDWGGAGRGLTRLGSGARCRRVGF